VSGAESPPDGTQGSGPVAGGLPSRRALVAEVWVVMALSLGASALFAFLDLLRSVTNGVGLRSQTAVINGSAARNELLNLAYQLAGIAAALVPVALVAYLLYRSGESLRDIGLDASEPWRELAWGAGLAAAVGGIGLAFYLAAFHAGLSVRVVPTTLPAVWWRVPVLLLLALENALVEEVVVCGYLLHRLEQIEWPENRALLTSATLRGAYHLYQGFGGFIGNFAMGLLFGRLYQRQRRLPRLVIAHALIDTGAFVGYVLLHGHVSWLP
jgi:membrane protease YdiL (CAAX protease family)